MPAEADSTPAFDPAAFKSDILGELDKRLDSKIKSSLTSFGDDLKKTIAETLKPAPQKEAASAEEAPLTKKDLDAYFTARDQATTKSKRRQDYIDSKMKDLPARYREGMPNTDDESELKAAEQRIRSEYQADFKTSGGKTENVGDANSDGGESVAETAQKKAVNTDGLSPVAVIAQELGKAKKV